MAVGNSIGSATFVRARPPLRRAFSIVELMVVIAIMAVLIAILLPTLVNAQKSARKVECQANLRSVGQILLAYVNENNGWLFPVGAEGFDGRPTTLGTNRAPNERWPMYASFKELKTAPHPPPWGSVPYVENPYNPDKFPARPYTPRVMQCREDPDAYEAHSYVLNKHLADKRIRYGSKNFGGLTSSEVIVMGEKLTTERDYYMERSDFNRVVEKYRHGVKAGSNYLYHDGHVGTVLPREALTGLDPWDVRVPEPTPIRQPTPGPNPNPQE
jgi:prepilin-type N-terminal cleavage/methylation domain-containing protein/prepilin-type processing-associated H-X9-DG protein